MRVILLRPPRFLWPFNSETSAFWQPLGLACLAGMVRRELPEIDIEIWDAPARQWGWKTIGQRLRDGTVDVLGVGEEAVSAHEALRAARLVKELHRGALVVAGGPYFSYAIEAALGSGYVDVLVRGEGEKTFVELLRHARDRRQWPAIQGIAFSDADGKVVRTPPRPLIDDMDSLPFPAYDLLNMHSYGRGSRNHPNLVSVEHSRGCIDSCGFCILWKHMGRSVDGNGTVKPCYRTKSAQRSFEEIRRLYRQFGRRTFGWVDPTFNASPQWSDQWAERMLGSDLMDGRGRNRTLHTAWVRADCLVRDHKLGILPKLVRAGLRQVMIGVERADAAGMTAVGKHNNDPEICREAFSILRQHYPQVYSIGTMIFGLPGDNRDDLRRLMRHQFDIDMDYCFLMPFTPNPGTRLADDAHRSGYVVNGHLDSYNFHTPVCRTQELSLRELESVYWRLMFRPDPRRLYQGLRSFFRRRDRRARRVDWALFTKGTQIAVRSLMRRILHPKDTQPTLYSRRPSWYET